jgi:hypothetical protein
MDRHLGLMRGGKRMNLLDIFTLSNFDNVFLVFFFLNNPKNVNFKAKKNPISSKTINKLVKMKDQRYFEV